MNFQESLYYFLPALVLTIFLLNIIYFIIKFITIKYKLSLFISISLQLILTFIISLVSVPIIVGLQFNNNWNIGTVILVYMQWWGAAGIGLIFLIKLIFFYKNSTELKKALENKQKTDLIKEAKHKEEVIQNNKTNNDIQIIFGFIGGLFLAIFIISWVYHFIQIV